MGQLHQLICDNFDDWIMNAPEHYKKDGFILDRKPIIIISQYGQNQEMITIGEGAEQEAESWRRKRDFKHVHYMSIAIATHFR